MMMMMMTIRLLARSVQLNVHNRSPTDLSLSYKSLSCRRGTARRSESDEIVLS